MSARRRIALCAGLGVGLAPGIAAAECHNLTAGYIHSGSWGRAPVTGNGVELSFMSWPMCADKDKGLARLLGIGAYGQAESVDGDGRFAGGVQLGHVVGIDAGYAFRSAAHGFATGHGPQLGAFVSLGIVSLGFRNAFYLGSGLGRAYGYEPSLVLGLKLPIPGLTTGDPIIWNAFDTWNPNWGPGGRPRRDRRGRPLLAEVRRATPLGDRRSKAGAPTRARRAEAWLADARAEHASVPAFVELGAELLVHGAPPELVDRCFVAAIEEMHHARMCFALASRWSGHRYDVAPEAPLAIRCRSRRALARESIIDGVVGEGVAAELAREAIARADDEDEASALAMIARDEGAHARLAGDIARWADADAFDRVARHLTAGYDLALGGSARELVPRARGREIGRAVIERLG